MLFWVSYMPVFYIFVFALVQCSWACFTWKSTLEIQSLLLSSLSYQNALIHNLHELYVVTALIKLIIKAHFFFLFFYLFSVFSEKEAYILAAHFHTDTLIHKQAGRSATVLDYYFYITMLWFEQQPPVYDADTLTIQPTVVVNITDRMLTSSWNWMACPKLPRR